MSEAGPLIFCLFLQRRNTVQESLDRAESMAGLLTAYQPVERQGSSIQNEADESGRAYSVLDMGITI